MVVPATSFVIEHGAEMDRCVTSRRQPLDGCNARCTRVVDLKKCTKTSANPRPVLAERVSKAFYFAHARSGPNIGPLAELKRVGLAA